MSASASPSNCDDPSRGPGLATMASPMAPDSQPSDDEAVDDGETTSLSASVLDYPSEWGRRYHRYKEDSYVFPNDADEAIRMDLQCECLNELFSGKIYLAPLHNPRRILDIGTGTGAWCIDMSDIFQHASITGTDLSAIQPSEVPANVAFEIADCAEPDWARKPASFDYIHTSVMMGALASFSNFIRTARHYLRPGTGWLECREVHPTGYSDDNSIPPDWAYNAWESLASSALESLDPPRSLRIAHRIAPWMRAAGFVDVHERIAKMPLNPWPRAPALKRLGKFWERSLTEGLQAFSYKPFGPRGLGWTKEQIEVFLVDVRKAVRDRHVHAYLNVHVVYGRRPTAEEERRMAWNGGSGAGRGSSGSGRGGGGSSSRGGRTG